MEGERKKLNVFCPPTSKRTNQNSYNPNFKASKNYVCVFVQNCLRKHNHSWQKKTQNSCSLVHGLLRKQFGCLPRNAGFSTPKKSRRLIDARRQGYAFGHGTEHLSKAFLGTVVSFFYSEGLEVMEQPGNRKHGDDFWQPCKNLGS